MIKKYFIKLFAIMIAVTYGNLCLTTANAAYPILSIDFGLDKAPAMIEPGFDVFTIADSGSKVKGITITLGLIPPVGGGTPTFNARLRGTPVGIPCERLYRDDIFIRPGGIRITLEGLWPNEPYEITIWAFDAGSAGWRIADYNDNGVYCLTTRCQNETPPTDCSSNAFTGQGQSDSNGVIVLEAYPNPDTVEQSGANNPYCIINGFRVASVNPILDATNPVPADGDTVPSTKVQLSWTPGMTATSRNVYFGETFEDVNEATTSDPEYRGSTTNSYFSVGSAGQPYPTGLPADKTYYWRIDETDGVSIWKGKVWSFYVPPKIPYNPTPVNGALFAEPDYLDTEAILSWYETTDANSYHVYFGDNLQNVQNGTGGTDKGTVTDPNYDPAAMLQLGHTYYWRVDAFDGTTTHTGAVWSFKTSPADCGLVDMDVWENITGGTTVNLLTGDARYPDSPTRTEKLTSWDALNVSTNYGGRIHGWLYVPLTGEYTFWLSSAGQGQLWLSTDEDPDNLRPEPIDVEPVWGTYGSFAHMSDPILLTGGNRYYIRAIWKDCDWDHCQVAWRGAGIRDQQIIRGCYLSPYAHYQAYRPSPADNAIDVELTPTLSWTPGEFAAQHDVYFGDNWDAVNDANSSDLSGPGYVYKGRQNSNTFDITTELNWGQTYYWRVDEVNDPNIWRGSVWSFTARNFLPIDDFESYTNSDPNIIFKIWKDGVGYSPGNGTGSQVGYRDPNYAEVTIVHGGAQSMPFDYNNTKTPYYSEASRTFDTPQNWTVSGTHTLKSLTLWFRGYPVSVGSFNSSTYTITASGTDIWDVPDIRHPSRFHDEFHYAYKEVTEADEEDLVTIVAKVESITNTNAWAKAAVMIRDSLDPNSTHGMMCVSPTSGVAFQRRLEKGGASAGTTTTGITAPRWVKLILDTWYGNIRAYHSATGNADDWTWIGDAVQPLDQEGNPSMTFPRGSPLYVGLALTSHDASATCEAVFSNVTITAGAAGAWKHQDIGIKSNVASPLYVTLQDSKTPTPGTKTITHSDPNILLQNTWQQWDIALSGFAGVDPTKIKKITVGVGNGSADGTGTIYVDDIRLYVPRCAPDLLRSAADFTGSDCTVDYQDLAILTDNWAISDWLVTPPVGWIPNSDPNLEAYYTFEGNFNDSSNGYNGEPNGATIVTDSVRGGQVANFDGSNDYVVLTNLGSLISSMSSTTIATWVNFSNTGGTWQRIFDFGTGTNVYMFLTPRVGTDGVMRFAITTGSAGAESQLNAPSTLATGWHHVAVVINGASMTMQLYLDGSAVVNGWTPTQLLPSNLGNTTQNWLGRSQWSGDAYFSGRLDEFRIYSRVLSQGEVAYLAGKTVPFNQALYLLLRPADPAINLYNDGVIDLRDYAGLADMWLEKLLWP